MDKNCVMNDFFDMINEAWTYGRLTDTERANLQEAFDRVILSGTYKQRWEQLNSLYTGFLAALGYFADCSSWRELRAAGRGYQLTTIEEGRR